MSDTRALAQAGSFVSLPRSARIGLDAARATSALYVVAHHAAGLFHLPPPIALVLSFGQEAVLVFFLLSGFVIFANESTRTADLRGYYLRRLRRIYPLLVFAMLVSTALWALGLIGSSPSAWSAVWTFLSMQDLSELKPGVIGDPYLANLPLWSISYEVVFYAIFPAVMVAWRRSARATRLGVPIASAAAYGVFIAAPNHFALVAAYFLIWWTGAVAADLYLKGQLTIRSLRIEIVGLALLIAVAASAFAFAGFHGFGFYPVLPLRHFITSLILVLVLASPVRSALARLSVPWARAWAALASISYGLYVLHYPLLIQPTVRVGSQWFVLFAAATFAAATLAERGMMHLIPKPRSRSA